MPSQSGKLASDRPPRFAAAGGPHTITVVVNTYNDLIGQFPDSLVATACGFTVAGQLRSTTTAVERAPVMVKFS